MPQYTKGFESIKDLRRHFQEHGSDFDVSSAEEYEESADVFLGRSKVSDIEECVRRCGYMIRYDPSTEAFGILDRDGIIRTYYKPIPCAKVPFAEREATRLAGRCHKYPINVVYFRVECAK